MAKFNEEIFNVDALTKHDKEMCSCYLQSLLTKEELNKLKDDWNKDGRYKVTPWWQYAFEHIIVSYH